MVLFVIVWLRSLTSAVVWFVATDPRKCLVKIGTAGVPPSKFVISPLSGNIGIDTGHDTLMLPYPPIKLPKPHVTRYLSFWHQYSTAKRAVLINISLISLACVAWRFCRAGRTSGEAAKAASCPNLLAVSPPSRASGSCSYTWRINRFGSRPQSNVMR